MPALVQRCLAAIVCVVALLTTGLASVARAADPVPPGDAALDWLEGELAANEGMLTVTFGTDAFPDPGLTIDAILAELAGGNGGRAAVQTAIGAVDAAVFDYVNQQSTFADDRAANATAKALLLQEVLGADLGPTVDLEADLRSLMATDGDEVGRFNDTDLQGFGNYANGLGQALAVLALDRTAGGVPADAVDFLLDQQCSDGSFRLYYFGYITSFDPFETVGDLTCADPADGDVDATALALSALLAVPSTPAVADRIDHAVGFLTGTQLPSGGFLGTGATNANSTGLAAQALRAAGAVAEADRAAAFLADIQLRACADFGPLAYDDAGFAAGIVANRDQWVRATTQAVLGLGLPSYADIGVVEPGSAGLDPIACQATTAPGDAPTVSLSATSVRAGDPLTVTATGFDGGETVDGWLHSTPRSLGTFTADATGQVAATVTVPADLEPGDHRVELVGRTSGVTVSASFEVLAAAGSAGNGTLPVTGTRIRTEAAVGISLVGLGTVVLMVGRRRQRAMRAAGSP